MIEIGNIVTLENQKEFLLLEELNKDGRRYVYAVGVLPDETPTNEYIIFEAVNLADGEYLKEINNQEEYNSIVEDFKEIISNKMYSGEYDQMIQGTEGEE
ncbi:MAG: DUF1292 domain-containing protein [Bacilli bacterium]|nr:DUF1292 domain-containing protein [Bacilli bacterium]